MLPPSSGQLQLFKKVAMGERINADYPPFSRVFVVCSKNHREEEVRKAFEAYGSVEDVWMVKDRMTKESKGICYVKYDKASSAALAIESLDGKTIGEEQKPIRVSGVIRAWCVCAVMYISGVCACVCVCVRACVRACVLYPCMF